MARGLFRDGRNARFRSTCVRGFVNVSGYEHGAAYERKSDLLCPYSAHKRRLTNHTADGLMMDS